MDVRNNFLSHLYIAFDRNGIHSFVDSEELRKGKEISPALMRAIEESHVAIIIFSEEHASSPWCLEELVKIMECKEQKGLKVLPVFYKVEPREVKVRRKSYGRNMAKHELKFGKDSEKVKRWKKTLFDAGNLSGWDMNNRDEAELIQCIVNELSVHLNRRPLYVTKYPVEIDSQVQKLIRLIQQESADGGVLMIGLWGPGGIGKTTIAKALYNAMERKFQGCSFLEQRKNVIKAIVLDLPTPKEMTISPNAFTNMRRLRMFIMPKVHIFSRGPICLPNELSWLEWANYPDLEFSPGQKKLVRLHVKNGHIKQLGSNFQNFINLKSIEFCDCKFLAIVPDLSSAPNLREVEFLENASSCPTLTHLDLSNNKFTHLPTCINKYDYGKDLFVYSCKESKGVSVADVSPLKVVEILVNGRNA
ncbi:disease resistance protein RPV1-like [Eucalyptus grandis]|uniref:disease resistance protein RPV1-like n=1 Tax=Eucalyptus grandis TaxID=71139 RepID=UPI00192E8ED4|nr:disease resistance protein RPV1-like [Eucalyptus grandis]